LAADDWDAGAGASLQAALGQLTQVSLRGNEHFWHQQGEAVRQATEAARTLAATPHLQAARHAFGHLSPILLAWSDTFGWPAALGLRVYTCGMATDMPEGGIWMQQSGAVRNPYYGAPMLACGAEASSIPMLESSADHQH